MSYTVYTYGLHELPLILEAELTVGEWFFDVDPQDSKQDITKEDWVDTIEELNLFLAISKKVLGIKEFIIEAKNLDMSSNQFDVIFRGGCQVDQLVNKLINLIKNDSISFKLGYWIELKGYGNCQIDGDNSVYSNLINIKIIRNNNVGIYISTNNLSYLPHHPVIKQRQYKLWKNNAPKLAKTIYEFSKKSKLKLLSSGDEMFPLGFFCKSNIFYLMNRAITGVEDPNWDEFHVPFELLDEKDYKFE